MSIKQNRINNIFLSFVVILLIGVLIFSTIKVIKYIVDNKENKKIEEEISDLVEYVEETTNNEEQEDNNNKYNIDFVTLKTKNSDTVCYLKVNGTDIENVVVKGNDNSYYLKHNFNKEYNTAGWIFADYHNKLDGTDRNVIIYGHNMRNNTMFDTLHNVLNEEWKEVEENRFITTLKARSKYNFDVDIKEEENFL